MRLIPNMYVKGDRETPHPFLSDKRVRHALRMAIDVDTIIDDVFLGDGEPVWTEFFRPPFDICDIPRPVYDLEGAKALLKKLAGPTAMEMVSGNAMVARTLKKAHR